MARPKKNPEITDENIGFNPFATDLVIEVNRKEKKVINKYGYDDMLPYENEATPFSKVYDVVGNKEVIDGLSVRGKELYLFIIHRLVFAKDWIHIDRKGYMRKMKIKSPNTFKLAVGELTKLYPASMYPNGECSVDRFIYPHSVFTDIYWINPKYLFKGSRVRKFEDKLKVRRVYKV